MDVTWLGASRPVQGVAELFNLRTLPQHIDRILLSSAFFVILYKFLAAPLTRFFIPKQWDSFSDDDKIRWRDQVASLAQSVIIGPACLYVLWRQRSSDPPGLMERLYQHYDLEMLIVDIAMGYFMLHFIISIFDFKNHGLQMILHATIGVSYIAGAYVRFLAPL